VQGWSSSTGRRDAGALKRVGERLTVQARDASAGGATGAAWRRASRIRAATIGVVRTKDARAVRACADGAKA
jgi:hypothetical protein